MKCAEAVEMMTSPSFQMKCAGATAKPRGTCDAGLDEPQLGDAPRVRKTSNFGAAAFPAAALRSPALRAQPEPTQNQLSSGSEYHQCKCQNVLEMYSNYIYFFFAFASERTRLEMRAGPDAVRL
jgi:hypothetical protein